VKGFGYKFDALSDSEPSELNVALATMFKAGHTPFALLQSAIPALRPVVSNSSNFHYKHTQAYLILSLRLKVEKSTRLNKTG
jgi:hypothetical protein